ncbi:hypothetical protein C8R43DRAFT_1112307 [Mycena crocata]|nr:hypothetical protein C8R43DRAFT_1112307 [Mycena crocata]
MFFVTSWARNGKSWLSGRVATIMICLNDSHVDFVNRLRAAHPINTCMVLKMGFTCGYRLPQAYARSHKIPQIRVVVKCQVFLKAASSLLNPQCCRCVQRLSYSLAIQAPRTPRFHSTQATCDDAGSIDEMRERRAMAYVALGVEEVMSAGQRPHQISSTGDAGSNVAAIAQHTVVPAPDRKDTVELDAMEHGYRAIEKDHARYEPGPRRWPKITLWKVLNTVLLVGFGAHKILATAGGDTGALSHLEWTAVISWLLIAYWGGRFEQEAPSIVPWLFEEDYTTGAGIATCLWLYFVLLFAVDISWANALVAWLPANSLMFTTQFGIPFLPYLAMLIPPTFFYGVCLTAMAVLPYIRRTVHQMCQLTLYIRPHFDFVHDAEWFVGTRTWWCLWVFGCFTVYIPTAFFVVARLRTAFDVGMDNTYFEYIVQPTVHFLCNFLSRVPEVIYLLIRAYRRRNSVLKFVVDALSITISLILVSTGKRVEKVKETAGLGPTQASRSVATLPTADRGSTRTPHPDVSQLWDLYRAHIFPFKWSELRAARGTVHEVHGMGSTTLFGI